MKSVVMPIIPPLELCRQIPEEGFGDSFFVWLEYRREGFCRNWRCNKFEWDAPFVISPRFSTQDFHFYRIDNPNDIEKPIIFPAPTLSEILGQFPNFHLMKWGGRNVPCTIRMKLDPETFSPEFENENPAAAALRLWLDSRQKTRPDAPTTPRAGKGDQNRP